jgi:hypothetical protein
MRSISKVNIWKDNLLLNTDKHPFFVNDGRKSYSDFNVSVVGKILQSFAPLGGRGRPPLRERE